MEKRNFETSIKLLMKTNSIITLIFLFLTSGFLLPAQPIRNLKTENLKGKVKEVRESYFIVNMRFGKIKSYDFIDSSVYKFDTKGNLVEEIIYTSKFTNYTRFSYQYDSAEKIVVLEMTYSDTPRYFKSFFEYDANGHLTEVNQFDSSGQFLSKNTYKHDSVGNIVEVNHYYKIDVLDWKQLYSYDIMGNKTEERIFFETNALTKKDTLKYDDHGNIVEYSNSHKYKPIKGEYTMECIYDQNDNLINEKIFYNGKPTLITFRKIEYYE